MDRVQIEAFLKKCGEIIKETMNETMKEMKMGNGLELPKAPAVVPECNEGRGVRMLTLSGGAIGILSESAKDMSTGKSDLITITVEKDRLSQAEIACMVQEAEMYWGEDESHKQNIEAKNGLENYCFTSRNSFLEEQLWYKFEGDDKDMNENAMQETLDGLDKNQIDVKGEIVAKQKELEGVVISITMEEKLWDKFVGGDKDKIKKAVQEIEEYATFHKSLSNG